MKVLKDLNQLRDRSIAGNKAATLAELRDAGFNVPPFFVISSAVGSGESSAILLQREIDLASSEICSKSHRVAVRSSSCEEDGENLSFAGQFDTFLDVECRDVLFFALKVARSTSSAHIDTYRKAQGAGHSGTAPSVLVQRMVRADAAGVAFAADPVSGDTHSCRRTRSSHRLRCSGSKSRAGQHCP